MNTATAGNKIMYTVNTQNFSKIPCAPICYWISANFQKIYNNALLNTIANPCKGVDTGDNAKFLRLWFEINNCTMVYPQSNKIKFKNKALKWYPYNKGGAYRRWYGNNDYLINWGVDGSELKSFHGSNLRNSNFYFDRGITWSTVGTGVFSVRIFNYGYLFDNGGSCIFAKNHLEYLLALLNSAIAQEILKLNPTLNSQPGDVARIPVKIEKESIVDSIACKNVELSKSDWDSFETSWDFKKHPLI